MSCDLLSFVRSMKELCSELTRLLQLSCFPAKFLPFCLCFYLLSSQSLRYRSDWILFVSTSVLMRDLASNIWIDVWLRVWLVDFVYLSDWVRGGSRVQTLDSSRGATLLHLLILFLKLKISAFFLIIELQISMPILLSLKIQVPGSISSCKLLILRLSSTRKIHRVFVPSSMLDLSTVITLISSSNFKNWYSSIFSSEGRKKWRMVSYHQMVPSPQPLSISSISSMELRLTMSLTSKQEAAVLRVSMMYCRMRLYCWWVMDLWKFILHLRKQEMTYGRIFMLTLVLRSFLVSERDSLPNTYVSSMLCSGARFSSCRLVSEKRSFTAGIFSISVFE